MKRILSLMLVIALTLCLEGCIRKPDPELEAAAKNMEAFNSISCQMDMNLTVDREGVNTPVQMRAFTKIMREEGLMHMHLDMNLGDKKLGSEIYRQQTGFESMEYRGIDIGDGLEWTRESGSVFSIASLIPSSDVLKYISHVQGTEESAEIGGRNCTRYEGYIEGPNLKLLLKVVSFMGQAGKEFSQAFSDKLQALRIPVSIYLDQQELLIVRIDLDAAELLEAAGILRDENIRFTSAELTVEYGDFDAVSEIVIPDEALNAPDQSAA